MGSKQMSFEEIKNNKDEFLKVYDIHKEFEKSLCSWEELMEIGMEHEQRINSNEYFNIIDEFISKIATFNDVHSYRYRIKKTDSLIKKIIVKNSEKNRAINKENYLTKISDLLGIRILYIFKEDYFSVHQQIMNEYEKSLAENVHIKLRTGDDESIYNRITDDVKFEHNSFYRSIHYTVYSNHMEMSNPKIEIQTRTIFEEGWSEINHKLVYKNEADKYMILKNASNILSSLVGDCDKLGALMKTIYDEYTNNINSSANETLRNNAVGIVLQRLLNE